MTADRSNGATACLACDLADGTRELPGDRVAETERWIVEHCIGPLGVGTLVVKPRRHVLQVADLTGEEADELGPLLQRTASVVRSLTGADQVYVCLWSHAGWEAVHIHFVVQPVSSELRDAHPQPGPSMQAAMFEEGALPDRSAVEAFCDRARAAFDADGAWSGGSVRLSDGTVSLRPWTRSDQAFLEDAAADPLLERYNALPQTPQGARSAVEGFERSWHRFSSGGAPSGVAFAIVDGSGAVVGMCGVDGWSSEDVAQIGYWLHASARGHGFATRAVRLMTSWLFELGAARVFLTVASGNEASVAVARRAGFTFEGTLQAAGVWRGTRHDLELYAALPQEWAAGST